MGVVQDTDIPDLVSKKKVKTPASGDDYTSGSTYNSGGGYYSSYGNRNGSYSEREPEKELELDNKRWVNRRRMAWICLYAILIVTAVMMFGVPVEKIKALENVITWFYFGMTSILGAYMGFATWANIAGRR